MATGNSRALHELYRFVRKQFQVLFHWAFRSSFNLSLAVLVHYRSQVVFSLTQWSGLLPTRFRVSSGTQESPRAHPKFRVRDYHSLWLTIPGHSTILVGLTLESYNPTFNACAWTWFGLFRFRSPLLTEYLPRQRRGTRFLFLRVLGCFGSPGHLACGYIPTKSGLLPQGSQLWNWLGFPIRKPSDQTDIGSYPMSIAANCVLLRQLVPRHSLFAFFWTKNPTIRQRRMDWAKRQENLFQIFAVTLYSLLNY